MDMASGGILAQLFGALNPMAKEEPFTKWDCTVVRLNVENGLGELSPMLGQAEKLTIVGAGKIDLRSEELDIEFNTKPRTGVGLTADMFVTPFVKVSGETLAQPGIGMNRERYALGRRRRGADGRDVPARQGRGGSGDGRGRPMRGSARRSRRSRAEVRLSIHR